VTHPNCEAFFHQLIDARLAGDIERIFDVANQRKRANSQSSHLYEQTHQRRGKASADLAIDKRRIKASKLSPSESRRRVEEKRQEEGTRGQDNGDNRDNEFARVRTVDPAELKVTVLGIERGSGHRGIVFYAAGIPDRPETASAGRSRWYTSRRGHAGGRHGWCPGHDIPVQFSGVGGRRVALPEGAPGRRVLAAGLDAAVALAAPRSQWY